ncbi:hypothetical protein BROUX41_004690 [Berkeleyomyces rouxiae]|uniref:uncharacterized protein n=1 Tax=Berkeleyomyces rouxiae TaxID=2035830 RepID=UPI003B812EB0
MPPKSLFNKSSPVGSRPRTSSASIRGKISAPIPFPDPLDDDYQLQIELQRRRQMNSLALAQSPISPPMSIPNSIPEGQPISMPIVPNSTLAQAQAQAVASGIRPAASFAPAPPSSVSGHEDVNASALAVTKAPSASTSPVPPVVVETKETSRNAETGSAQSTAAPSLPHPVRPSPTPSPVPAMNMTSSNIVHGRSYSQNQMYKDSAISNNSVSNSNTNSSTNTGAGGRTQARSRPPISSAIIRTSAAMSVGTERTSKTSTILTASDNMPAVSSSLRSQTHSHSQSLPQNQSQSFSQVEQVQPENRSAAVPERKKSTLRSALGRIFGKKRAKTPQLENSLKLPEGRTVSMAPGPTEASRVHQFQPPVRPAISTPEPKRSISLSVVEHDTEHDRALHSHSVGPRDMIAIESARNSANLESTPLQSQLQSQIQAHQEQTQEHQQVQPKRNEVDPQSRPQSQVAHSTLLFNAKRRAASTGGDFFVPPRTFFAEPSGLSPRPASSQCRNRTPQEDELPGDDGSELVGTGTGTGIGMGVGVSSGAGRSEEIGKAITSQEILRNRRRSRSVPGIALTQGSPTRRRSDEIRYWRQSHVGAFALSPNYNRGPMTDDLANESDIVHDSDDNDNGLGHAVDAGLQEAETPRPSSSQQPFDFGAIASSMKITEAITLEARVGKVEGRINRLEKTLHSFHHVLPGFRLTDDGAHFDMKLSLDTGACTAPVQTSTMLMATESNISDTSRGGTSLGDVSTNRTSFGTGTTLNDRTGMGSRSSADARSRRPSSSQNSEDSNTPFVQTPVFPSSLHAAPAPPPRAMSPSPTSATTPGPLSVSGLPVSGDQYTRLLSLIEAERAARVVLEAEVYRLTRALNMASSPASGRRPTLTASTSALPLSSSAPPRNFSLNYAVSPFGRTANEMSVFDDDVAPKTDADDDRGRDNDSDVGPDAEDASRAHGGRLMHSQYTEDSTFLASDSSPVEPDADGEQGLDSSLSLGGETDSSGVGVGLGIHAQDAQRKTARTLSLSQLTHGTKPRLNTEKQLEYEMEHTPLQQHAL